MTESKLNPFDAELLVMIGDIAKSQPEVEEKPPTVTKSRLTQPKYREKALKH